MTAFRFPEIIDASNILSVVNDLVRRHKDNTGVAPDELVLRPDMEAEFLEAVAPITAFVSETRSPTTRYNGMLVTIRPMPETSPGIAVLGKR